MQIYTVTHADKSKNGKDRVFFNGKNEWQDAFYLSPKCPMPPMGAKIEANTHSWRPPNGKSDMWFLDDFRLASDQPPIEEVKATVAASAATGDAREKFNEREAKARLVSNVLGSALAALRLQKPEELMPWGKEAMKVADMIFAEPAMPKARIPGAEFDDDLP
jgi:hypothetical protein